MFMLLFVSDKNKNVKIFKKKHEIFQTRLANWQYFEIK